MQIYMLRIGFWMGCSLLLLTYSGLAQSSGLPSAGARGMAMGGTGVTFTDVHALWSNPAGLAEAEHVTAALFGELRYGQAELKLVNAAANLPTGSGNFGLTLSYFGFESYNEQSIGLAYARKLFDRLSIGAQVFALGTRIPDYGNRFRPSFELGLYSPLRKNLHVGVRLRNPVRIIWVADEYLPTFLTVGFQYRSGDDLRFLVEMEKDTRYTPRLRTGIEYGFADVLHLRLGVATSPALLSFGMGYRVAEQLLLDVAATYHDVLGISPAVTIRYRSPGAR